QVLRAEVLEDALNALLEPERVRPRRPDDRPAAGEEPGHLPGPERREQAVDEATPAVEDADHVVAARERAPSHRPDDRVQPRAVAAPREHAYPHRQMISHRCPSRSRKQPE